MNLWREILQNIQHKLLLQKKEMHFDNLTITGDYSDCDILVEEQETISLNDIF